MAFSSTIFILFSLASASTIAHSLVVPPTIDEVIIVGQLVCTATGNPVPGILAAPVAGAKVTFSCNGGATYLGQGFTDPYGFYLVVLSTADGLPFHESACAIFIPLPVGNCPLLPPTGTLRAPVTTLLDMTSELSRSFGLAVPGVLQVMANASLEF